MSRNKGGGSTILDIYYATIRLHDKYSIYDWLEIKMIFLVDIAWGRGSEYLVVVEVVLEITS